MGSRRLTPYPGIQQASPPPHSPFQRILSSRIPPSAMSILAAIFIFAAINIIAIVAFNLLSRSNSHR
jgi:hypothetical protein